MRMPIDARCDRSPVTRKTFMLLGVVYSARSSQYRHKGSTDRGLVKHGCTAPADDVHANVVKATAVGRRAFAPLRVMSQNS